MFTVIINIFHEQFLVVPFKKKKNRVDMGSMVLLFLVMLSLFWSNTESLDPASLNDQSSHNNVNSGIVLYDNLSTLNRRRLLECPFKSPYLQMQTSTTTNIGAVPVPGEISDAENVTVTISGVLNPSKDDWVAMISPSHSSAELCPQNTFMYKQTGDFSDLPLLCHYPVKALYLKSDPDYLSCNKSKCQEMGTVMCKIKTCSASVTFHVINIRTEIEFVLFRGGFVAPCILKRTEPLRFAHPERPLYGHLSSIDSSATSMRLTWVSGSKEPQQVQYGHDGRSHNSNVVTFTQDDMCGDISSPAKDFGWHDPGYIHTAGITGLEPSTNFSYRYGSESVGWSAEIQARTPPAGGSNELVKILAFGDMGKAPLDSSAEHYIQPGSLSVTSALADEVATGNVGTIFHIGDISYATGFLVEWDYFLHLIEPFASRVSYMTAIGNHERDYMNSGSVYNTPDSGGECGVPYEAYFPMPSSGKDSPWYSIEIGTVHFTVISTEHSWHLHSPQYEWIQNDLRSVNRSRTPWLIFAGHRPMYSSSTKALLNVDPLFVATVEPLLLEYKVDLAIFGHVHNYERTCAMYRGKCKAMPVKGEDGIDTYNNTEFSAPVQVVMGMAGFSLDGFFPIVPPWSLSRISKYGYTRMQARKEELKMEFVNSNTRQVEDSFRIVKADT